MSVLFVAVLWEMDKLMLGASHELLRERKGSRIVGVGECLCAHVQLCFLTKRKLACLSVCHRRAEQGFCVPSASERFMSLLS